MKDSVRERTTAIRALSDAARKLGARGGIVGSALLTPEQRKERAQLAAKARWDKKRQADAAKQPEAEK